MGPEFFGGNAGGESASARGNLDVILGFVFQNFFQHFNDVLFAVDDQDSCAPGHEAVERHAVVLHESDQLIQRDSPVLAAGDAIAVQRTGVEPFAHAVRGATRCISLATSPGR